MGPIYLVINKGNQERVSGIVNDHPITVSNSNKLLFICRAVSDIETNKTEFSPRTN